MTPRRAALACVAAAVLAGCGTSGAPSIAVEHLAASANAGRVSAAYGSLVNHGDAPDALVGASCTCAESVSIHRTDRRDGLSVMVPADRLDLPAGERVALAPGGSHLMLEGLTGALAAGDVVEITFEFERSGSVTHEAEVVDPAELADRVEPSDEGA